jgi:hypothetical protein
MADIIKDDNDDNIHDNTQDLPITDEIYEEIRTTLGIEDGTNNTN